MLSKKVGCAAKVGCASRDGWTLGVVRALVIEVDELRHAVEGKKLRQTTDVAEQGQEHCVEKWETFTCETSRPCVTPECS